MERLISPEEKKKLVAYIRPHNILSRIALYIVGPAWVIIAGVCAYQLYQAPSLEAWASANDSWWSTNRIEMLMGLTVLFGVALWHNTSERFEIGRVKQVTGTLSRATGESSKGYRLNGQPLVIPYTLDLDISAFVDRPVIVELAEVLRTERGKGKTTERYVVAVKLNDFTSAG